MALPNNVLAGLLDNYGCVKLTPSAMLARKGRFLRRSIPDQQHDTFEVVSTAFGTDPASIKLAFANQAWVVLDVKIEREGGWDPVVVAHAVS